MSLLQIRISSTSPIKWEEMPTGLNGKWPFHTFPPFNLVMPKWHCGVLFSQDWAVAGSSLHLCMSVKWGELGRAWYLKQHAKKFQRRVSQPAEKTTQNVNTLPDSPEAIFLLSWNSISFSFTRATRSQLGHIWITQLSSLLGLELWMFSKMKGTLKVMIPTHLSGQRTGWEWLS